MKRITLFIIILCFSPFFFIQAQGATAEINYYTGGEGSIELQAIPEKVTYKFKLSGKTKYKYLLFQISRLNNSNQVINQRDIQLNNQENFDYYYYFKDGPGKYQVIVFGPQINSKKLLGLCYFNIESTEGLPFRLSELSLNQEVISYMDTVMGKPIGRGECWDLAQEILDLYMADWKRPTGFGIVLDPQKEAIKPGDIIQMYNLKLEYDNHIEYFGLPQHTAIIYKVLDKDHYLLAHQNVAGKRYVLKSEMNLKHLKSGTLTFYRPIAGFTKIEK